MVFPMADTPILIENEDDYTLYHHNAARLDNNGVCDQHSYEPCPLLCSRFPLLRKFCRVWERFLQSLIPIHF